MMKRVIYSAGVQVCEGLMNKILKVKKMHSCLFLRPGLGETFPRSGQDPLICLMCHKLPREFRREARRQLAEIPIDDSGIFCELQGNKFLNNLMMEVCGI